ncbi:MAG: glycoside hydrolase family 127 protein [Planctomycetes bacterium]|nr:glycoside hydrolase family 127 protein [Planctomycetota bacterium]
MRCPGLVALAVSTLSPVCTGQLPVPDRHAVEPEHPQRVTALGETRVRLTEALDRLCSPPLSDLDFVLADVELDLTRRFTEYSGDISGRMLGALQSASPILGREVGMVERLAAAFPGAQRADGHFGCEQDLDDVNQRRDMPILWGNGRLLLAMAERLRDVDDPELLAAAMKLGEYVISTREYYGRPENFERVGGHFASGFTTCYPSLVDGMAALGEVTGDRRFSEEARFIARLSLLDDSLDKRHSHGRLTAFRGMLDLDRGRVRPEFVPVVAATVRRITDDLVLPSGGITEQFDRDDPRDEGCSEGDWIRVNVLLWQATGDVRFLDTAEHAIRNHLAGTQQRNGGFGHCYWGKLAHGDDAYAGARIRSAASESYWCCSMHCTQVLADVARWSILGAGGEIVVTWLGEAKSELRIGDRTVTVTARREGPSVWQLSFDSADSDRVRLRVPGWAGRIEVDGRTCEVEDGWAELVADGAVTWRVEFPDVVELRGPYGDAVVPGQPVRVFAAGELYCLPESELAAGSIGPDDVPRVLLAATRPERRTIPVVLVAGDRRFQRATLVPLSTRPWGGSRLLLDVQRVDARELGARAAVALAPPVRGVPVELTVGCDGRVEAWLNGREVTRTGQWVETPTFQTFSDGPTSVLALKVFSDRPRPGVIAMVRVGGRLHVTGAGDWTAIPCDPTVDPRWLVDAGAALANAVPIADLGGFGADPWKHMSAGYAGSGARWVWPEQRGEPRQRWWLLRCELPIPPVSEAQGDDRRR